MKRNTDTDIYVSCDVSGKSASSFNQRAWDKGSGKHFFFNTATVDNKSRKQQKAGYSRGKQSDCTFL